MRKKRTLQFQLRKLLQGTIISLIFIGSIVYSIASLFYMKENNLDQLEHIVNHFYNEVVENNREQALFQAQELVRVIEKFSFSQEQHFENEIKKTAAGSQYWIFDRNKKLIYSNAPLPMDGTPHQVEELLQRAEETWIEGSHESGIYVYSSYPIMDNDALSYVLVAVEITNDKYVQNIKDDFDIDSSIFFEDLRIVTSVKEKNQTAIRTEISPKIYEELLLTTEVVKGQIKVVGIPYLAAYRSFGNPGDVLTGIVGVGKPLNDYINIMRNIFFSIVIIGLSLMAMATLVSRYWMKKYIVAPIKLTTDSLIYIGEGYKNFQGYVAVTNQFEEFNQLNRVIYHLLKEVEISKQKIEKIAYFNELTQLPNRFYLYKKWSIENASQTNQGFLMYLDMDNLKVVNDILGHKVGDQLIKAIGKRLQDYLASVSNQYELYHFGGGEFIIFGEMIENLETVEGLAKEILVGFEKPFFVDSNVFNTTATIGIALYEDKNTTGIEQLVQNAGVAMDQTKKVTKGNYLIYTDEMVYELKKQQEFEEDLKHALVDRELFLVYQPKLELSTGRCDSFEALIRWRCPKRGIVPPLDFIKVAEETGLIIEIGQWVLEEACKFAKILQKKYHRDIKIAVNISTLQVIKEDFVKSVLSTLLYYELNPQCIELEITESVLIEYLSTAVEKLRKLNVLGVDISIDDFGKGYSSLAYLRKLPITTLKIDKLFIDDIIETQDLLVGDIIKLGHHMGLKVIAEGVEVAEQMRFLKEAGCDCIQGYYYSRPLTEEDSYLFLDLDNREES